MAEFVYSLCAVTAVICALLLFRGYRTSRSSLLFWASLCFIGLAANNLLLLVDRYVVPQVDLLILRSAVALAAMSVLVYGLIVESR